MSGSLIEQTLNDLLLKTHEGNWRRNTLRQYQVASGGANKHLRIEGSILLLAKLKALPKLRSVARVSAHRGRADMCQMLLAKTCLAFCLAREEIGCTWRESRRRGPWLIDKSQEIVGRLSLLSLGYHFS